MKRELIRRAREAHHAMAALRQAAEEAAGTRSEADQGTARLEWVANERASDLARRALMEAEERTAADATVRTGHVYCYHCNSASCEHARPRSAGEVFQGYGSTGIPCWEEFFQVLLQLNDPRTDLLFKGRGELLARVIGRRRLTEEQLQSFGRDSLTYRIWGQVIAGYLEVDGQRSALTVQIVEARDRALHLQTIATESLHAALVEAPAGQRSAFHRIHEAVRASRHELGELSRRWQAGSRKEQRTEIRQHVFRLLRHIAHSVERKGRQHRRRTAHAEARGQEQRPVHKAHDDLRAAADDAIYDDRMKKSLVLRGRHGRLHAFSREGRHITSLVLRSGEFDRRVRRKRYAPLDPASSREFLERARARAAEKDDERSE